MVPLLSKIPGFLGDYDYNYNIAFGYVKVTELVGLWWFIYLPSWVYFVSMMTNSKDWFDISLYSTRIDMIISYIIEGRISFIWIQLLKKTFSIELVPFEKKIHFLKFSIKFVSVKTRLDGRTKLIEHYNILRRSNYFD